MEMCAWRGETERFMCVLRFTMHFCKGKKGKEGVGEEKTFTFAPSPSSFLHSCAIIIIDRAKEREKRKKPPFPLFSSPPSFLQPVPSLISPVRTLNDSIWDSRRSRGSKSCIQTPPPAPHFEKKSLGKERKLIWVGGGGVRQKKSPAERWKSINGTGASAFKRKTLCSRSRYNIFVSVDSTCFDKKVSFLKGRVSLILCSCDLERCQIWREMNVCIEFLIW